MKDRLFSVCWSTRSLYGGHADLMQPVVCTVPGRAADGAGTVEIREAESSRSQSVQVGSEGGRVSVTAQIPETQIICE